MNLSIIIPVSTDFRLLECLGSVDADIEIVVVFNNNPSRRLIKASCIDSRVKAVVVDGPGCNLAYVFNIGIRNASCGCVLLMNSDCIFCPGQIKVCYDTLQKAPIVKGRILFELNSLSTKLVAELRFLFHEVFFEGNNLYGPGLAFHRDIVNQIGGYYFDEKMGWGEDGELSERIHASGLEIVHLKKIIMKHPPESMLHDLRIAYKIGQGEWIQHCKDGMTLPKAVLTDILNLFFDRSRRFRITLIHGGYFLVSYLLIWKLISHLGYYIRAFKRKGGCDGCKN